MKFKIVIIFIAVSFLPLFAGCDTHTFFDIQETITHPIYDEDENSIKSIIKQNSEENIIWKYPSHGDYKSGIVFCSPDNNHTQALASYSFENSNSVIYSMVLQKNEGVWNPLNVYKNDASSIDKIIVADITGNGNNEVIIGWNDPETSHSKITAYTFDKSSPIEIDIYKNYSDFTAFDFNNDNKAQLFFTFLDGNKDLIFQTASIQDTAVNKSEISIISHNVEKYENICAGIIDDKKRGVCVDYRQYNTSTNTSILYWNFISNSLHQYNQNNELLNPERNIPVLCSDINNDGKVEIPVVKSINGLNSEDNFYIIEWSNADFASKKFRCVQRSLYGYETDYTLVVPNEWESNFSVCSSDDNTIQTFKKVIYENNGSVQKENEVFKICKISESLWDKKRDTESSFVLDKYHGYVYTAEIYDRFSDLNINKEKLIKNFKINKS